jgi:hypothetical protein
MLVDAVSVHTEPVVAGVVVEIATAYTLPPLELTPLTVYEPPDVQLTPQFAVLVTVDAVMDSLNVTSTEAGTIFLVEVVGLNVIVGAVVSIV